MDINIINLGISLKIGHFNSPNYSSIQEGKKMNLSQKDIDHQINKCLWIWDLF